MGAPHVIAVSWWQMNEVISAAISSFGRAATSPNDEASEAAPVLSASERVAARISVFEAKRGLA